MYYSWFVERVASFFISVKFKNVTKVSLMRFTIKLKFKK